MSRFLERGVGRFKKDEDKAKAGLAKTLVEASKAWRDAYGEIPLPQPKEKQLSKTQPKESTPKIDLRRQTYELLALVREPTEEERKTLEKKGIVFLPAQTKSLSQVVSEDQDYFWSGELDYANSRPELRDYIPPVPLQVGLNFENPAIPESFNRSKRVQLEMIEEQSQELQKEFPDARLVMLPSTVYSQADKAYFGKTGQVLFRNIFARALDQTSGVHSASVGRRHPDSRLGVYGCYAEDGDDFIGAVPAVVFLRK